MLKSNSSDSVNNPKRIKIDSQDCLNWVCKKENLEDEESMVNALIESLSQNNMLKEVDIAGSFISERSTEMLFFSFMGNKHLVILNMPLWRVVNTPSQKSLEYMTGVFESSLLLYNRASAKDQARFKLFARMNEKGFKDIKNIKSMQVQNYSLPDICLQKIEDYLVPIEKRLFL